MHSRGEGWEFGEGKENSVNTVEDVMKHLHLLWSSHVLVAFLKKPLAQKGWGPDTPSVWGMKAHVPHYATFSTNCKDVWELSCFKGNRTHTLYGLTNIK